MRRSLLRAAGLARASLAFCLLGFLLPPTAFAQTAPTRAHQALPARPAAQLPVPPASQWIQDFLPQGDSLSEADLARRVARLYTKQAELLTAEAEGSHETVEALLTGTMRDLRQLAMRPGVADQARFRELYRSILSEYERFHGPSPELALEQGDIYEIREAMFAALDGLHDPLLEDVNLPRSIMATFPMTVNRAVENQLRFYLRNNRHVARVRERAETYFPMFEQILTEEGVPDELKYLAVIESALNPVARSWAGAAGMWQFIPATGRHMGLVVTHELDERLDPEKATRAAARHLVELYTMFGDWQLAIAGYNMNPYRLKRYVDAATARLGRPATYWDVYDNIPRETRGYIPSFIAVALIMSNPEVFELGRVTHPGPRYEFDVIPVRGGTTLAAIAQRAGTDLRTLQALNPGLRQSRVPDWADGYDIRLPAGHYLRYQRDLAAVVRQGRTADLAPRTVAYAGSNRRVIGFAQAQSALTRPAADAPPAIPVQQVAADLRSGRSAAPQAPATTARSSTPAARTAAPAARTAAPSRAPQTQRITYRVRQGDNLTKIARAHGVTVAQLRQWNNIRGSHIRIGQRLTIERPAGRRS
jgi:membrane-bound lytic murein transglycosylase D